MPGTRPGVRLSWTLYLLRMLYTVLLLRTPLSFQISRIEYPLLYISTIFLSRSVLLILFLVIGILILCCRRIILSDDFRKTATSSGNAPNMANTSAGVVSGNNLLSVSILSWMEIIRTTLMRHSSINAYSSRKPRTALLNFDTTNSSPLSRFDISCFHLGLSVSCPTDSSTTCTHPYWRIHSLSASNAS